MNFHCLGHHKKKQEKLELERQEALAKAAAVTPPRYGGMGPRPGFMPQRSPRFGSPRQQSPHPVALRASPGARMRHEPYSVPRPPRRGSLNMDQQGRGPLPRPVANRVDGQVIKIEPEDDESNQGAQSAEGAQETSQPSSPSVNPETPSSVKHESSEKDDDAKSESSSSTIPNESADINKLSDAAPPGGLSLDSDLSNLISAASTSTSESVHDTIAGEGLDPNVSVKLETMGDSDMDLEITGVELGSHPLHEQQMGSQDWAQMGGMPAGATGGPGDMAAGQQGYSKCLFQFYFFNHLPNMLYRNCILHQILRIFGIINVLQEMPLLRVHSNRNVKVFFIRNSVY